MLQTMALMHANPYIRQAAYQDHERDWHLDVENQKFTLEIRDPERRTLAGTFVDAQGTLRPRFDDDEKLAGPWTPPADAALDFETARTALVAMCNDWSFDTRLSNFGAGLKNVQAPPEGDVVDITAGAGSISGQWRIDLKARTFHVSQSGAGTGSGYDGTFGWDKNKHWVAWPTYVMNVMGGPRGGRGTLAIPNGVSPPDHPATAPAMQTGGR
jgi:hypothetical protein